MKKNRYLVEVAVKLDRKLTRLAQKKEITKEELFRRALALYALVQEKTQPQKNQNHLAIVNEKNEVEYLILLS